jgi:large subunit ribosomal protein L16
MLFCPKIFKHKKHQKGKIPNIYNYNWSIIKKSKNSIKLVSSSFGRISIKELTSIRLLIRKFIRKKKFFFFNVFPSKILTKKPLEVRMGKGKGNFSSWVALVKPGTVICEILINNYSTKKPIIKVLKCAKIRLNLKTIIKL